MNTLIINPIALNLFMGCNMMNLRDNNILKFLSSPITGGLSSKRLIVYRANQVVLGSFASISAACTYWIIKSGDLGSGAVAALTFVGGIAATIAIGYGRQQDQHPKER